MSSQPTADSQQSEPVLDLEARELCPDGNCVGVVDERGVCKVCGTSGTGEPVAPGPVAPQTDGGELSAVGNDDEIESRSLCSDGACIGVIGPDGKCKACGLPLAS